MTIHLIITYFFKVTNSGISLKASGQPTDVLDPKKIWALTRFLLYIFSCFIIIILWPNIAKMW